MKIIDHVTKEQIGEMEFANFSVNSRFKIPLGEGRVLRLLVTDVDYSDNSITVFELSQEQWDNGHKIKDVLV